MSAPPVLNWSIHSQNIIANLVYLTQWLSRKETSMAKELNEWHAQNYKRMSEAFSPPHSLMALVVCVQEEVGELAAAVLGVTGEKKRKAHMTNEDVLDAVADAMTYLSLVASSVGCTDLEKLLGDTFNMVSVRANSTIKTGLGQDPIIEAAKRIE